MNFERTSLLLSMAFLSKVNRLHEVNKVFSSCDFTKKILQLTGQANTVWLDSLVSKLCIKGLLVRLKAYLVPMAGLIISAFANASSDVAIQVRSNEVDALRAAVGGANVMYQEDYVGFSVLRVPPHSIAQVRVSGIGFEQLQTNNIRFGAVDLDALFAGAAESSPRAGLKLVQFQSQAKQEWLDALQSRGMDIIQAYPGNAYLVWANKMPASRAWLPTLRWSGDYLSTYKIDPSITARAKPNVVIENIVAQVYSPDLELTIAQLRAFGANVINYMPAQPDKKLYDVYFKATPEQIQQMTQVEKVLSLSYASPRGYFDDEISSQIVIGNTQTGGTVTGPGYLAALSNLGLSGNGVIWAVTDSGVDLSHPEFAGGRIAGGYTFPGCPAGTGLGDDNANGGHGTHVAGIIAGAGTLNILDANSFNYGVGVAPQAKIFAQNPICLGGQPWPPAGGWQENSKQAILGGALGTNNSWTSGEGTNVGYTNGARAHDFIVRDGNFDTATVNDPFVVVFSAGNSGPNANTLTAPKESKNPIIVGASNNQRAGSIDNIASFSSRGPAVDGRILPTITAPGAAVASTRRVAGAQQCGTAITGTNGNYALCSGTSMAAPQVSGMAALLIEWYRARFAGATPSPAMLKALMVNGAIDMAGVADTIPNTVEGWGRVNLKDTATNNKILLDQTQILTEPGAAFERTWAAADTTKPVRLTLTWTDAPAAISANPTLVNDLDLTVTVGANTYLGNVFASGLSATGGSPDRKNNVESVYLPPGTQSLRFNVRAQSLPGDGVPNSGDATDQDFALVCDNCVERPGFTMSAPSALTSVCANKNLVRPITIGQILSFNTPVTLSNQGLPAPGTVSFSVNPVPTPGQTVMTVSPAGMASGIYPLKIDAIAGTETRSLDMPLFVAAGVPMPPTLSTPANAAIDVAVLPTLAWAAQADAFDYLVQISTTANFSTVVQSAVVMGTSFSPTRLNFSTTYYWRVVARNSCETFAPGASFGFEDGEPASVGSTVSSFLTVPPPPEPGDCPAGTTTSVVFNDNMEGGAPGWTSLQSVGTNTWAITTDFPASPTRAYRNVAPTLASDVSLTSPTITLPATGSPRLQFSQHRGLEPNGANACYDGGLLEIAANGGPFSPVTSGITGVPYTGTLPASVLGGRAAWCGEFPHAVTAIDLSSFLGQSIQIRFRLGSDGSANRPAGWNIDDVRVKNCL
jgi:subtilisin family serine protease